MVNFGLWRVWVKGKGLRAAFAVARLVRDLGLARFLLRTKLARAISRRFEFALCLLDGSSDYRTGSRPGSPGGQPGWGPGDVGVRTVLLFKGCVTEGLFRRVNDATRRVLKVNGFESQAPAAQVCCGALHAHAGDLDGARTFARENVDAFSGSNDPIITNAGGCGSLLLSYTHLTVGEQRIPILPRHVNPSVRAVGGLF